MTVKKEMSPDTVIKLRFDPSDTADVVYQRFNAKVQEVKNVLEVICYERGIRNRP